MPQAWTLLINAGILPTLNYTHYLKISAYLAGQAFLHSPFAPYYSLKDLNLLLKLICTRTIKSRGYINYVNGFYHVHIKQYKPIDFMCKTM